MLSIGQQYIAQGEKAIASGVWLPGKSRKYKAGKV